MDVSENSGTPKSSILIGFSIINHPFWGVSLFLETPKWLRNTVSWWKLSATTVFPEATNLCEVNQIWWKSWSTGGRSRFLNEGGRLSKWWSFSSVLYVTSCESCAYLKVLCARKPDFVMVSNFCSSLLQVPMFFFFFGWKTRSALGRCKRPSKLSARRYFQTWFASLTLSCIACPQFRECQHPSSHNHGSVENGSLLY